MDINNQMRIANVERNVLTITQTLVTIATRLASLETEKRKTLATIAQLQVENEALAEAVDAKVKVAIHETTKALMVVMCEMHRQMTIAGLDVVSMDTIITDATNIINKAE